MRPLLLSKLVSPCDNLGWAQCLRFDAKKERKETGQSRRVICLALLHDRENPIHLAGSLSFVSEAKDDGCRKARESTCPFLGAPCLPSLMFAKWRSRLPIFTGVSRIKISRGEINTKLCEFPWRAHCCRSLSEIVSPWARKYPIAATENTVTSGACHLLWHPRSQSTSCN